LHSSSGIRSLGICSSGKNAIGKSFRVENEFVVRSFVSSVIPINNEFISYKIPINRYK
jgi:hypothetical protein